MNSAEARKVGKVCPSCTLPIDTTAFVCPHCGKSVISGPPVINAAATPESPVAAQTTTAVMTPETTEAVAALTSQTVREPAFNRATPPLQPEPSPASVPWFGARKLARSLLTRNAELVAHLDELRAERHALRQHLETLGALDVIELGLRKNELEKEIEAQSTRLTAEAREHGSRLAHAEKEHQVSLRLQRADAESRVQALQAQLAALQKTIVATEEVVLLQEAGVYQYRHPLSDAVAYEKELADIEDEIKEMTKKDGGAVLAITNWTVNGSATEGRRMVRDFSKLMLRAFNAEADNLVRGLKPYKLGAAIDRLAKVAGTIEKLGKTMQIRISTPYLQLREREMELTADWLQKQAEEKEAERAERERLREERKVQQEMERERAKLEKERQHYLNALEALSAKGDEAGAERVRSQLGDVERAIEDVDYRAANIRAGYVYVISNIGSFGEALVKVGMTRRLDPMERIRELSDASVPFNFDAHALFFSKDAVGIEAAMHERLADARVNLVNRRREFFRATPHEVKTLLAQLTGELLEFTEVAEALEYRQSIVARTTAPVAG